MLKNEVLELIKGRRTTRSFKPDLLSEEEIMTLLEAASFAPSGHNMQPWHFTVVTNQELIQEMSDRSKEAFKEFPDEMLQKIANNPNFKIFYGAPVVMVVSYLKDAITPIDDISAASQNILLQADSMGIGCCWNGMVMGIFGMGEKVKEEFIKKLNIPENYEPHHAIALGYPLVKPVNAPKRKENFYNFVK